MNHKDKYMHISKDTLENIGFVCLIVVLIIAGGIAIVMGVQSHIYDPILPNPRCHSYCTEQGYETGYFGDHTWGRKTLDGSPALCYCGNNKDRYSTEVEVNYSEPCEKWWWCK